MFWRPMTCSATSQGHSLDRSISVWSLTRSRLREIRAHGARSDHPLPERDSVRHDLLVIADECIDGKDHEWRPVTPDQIPKFWRCVRCGMDRHEDPS